jgi:hypothetical protein
MKATRLRKITVALFFTTAGFVMALKSPFAAPGSILGPLPIPFRHTLTVSANKQSNLALCFEYAKAPGSLHGHWSVQGSSANIKGATDDTVTSFKFTDPTNLVLEHHDNPTAGNFNLKYTGGTYTMTFDNTSNSSDRTVTVEGTYQPQ